MADPVLKIGAQGDAVRTLQVLLTAAGFDTNGADGDFGPHTDTEVRAFQAATHLGVDGVVGPASWAALREAVPPGPPPPPPPPASSTTWSPSDAGLRFIGFFEGFRGNLYNDANGNCTIGYGHLVHLGTINGSEPPAFSSGITQAQALDLLRTDAASAAATVNKAVPHLQNQHQFDALLSFCFNIGAGGFDRSTICRLAAGGHLNEVPAALSAWKRPGAPVLAGLTRRRAAEANLFQNGSYSAG